MSPVVQPSEQRESGKDNYHACGDTGIRNAGATATGVVAAGVSAAITTLTTAAGSCAVVHVTRAESAALRPVGTAVVVLTADTCCWLTHAIDAHAVAASATSACIVLSVETTTGGCTAAGIAAARLLRRPTIAVVRTDTGTTARGGRVPTLPMSGQSRWCQGRRHDLASKSPP